MPRSFQFIFGILSFLLGVSTGSFLIGPNLLAYVASFFAFLIFIVVLLRLRQLFFLFIVSFIIGFLRLLFTIPVLDTDHIAFYKNLQRKLEFTAIVSTEPDFRADKQYLVLSVDKLFLEDQIIPITGNVLLKVPRYPEFAFRDYLKVSGKLLSPQQFDKFDYPAYLGKDAIFAVMYSPQIEKITQQNLASDFLAVDIFSSLIISFWKNIFLLREGVSFQINQIVIEPASSILAGLLLGIRKNIDENLIEAFNQVGLTHILAISGYNITLLINVFALFLHSFPRLWRFGVTAMFLLLFCTLTGLSASVVRAGLMGFFTILATQLGRKAQPLLILMFSAFLMVLINPRTLNSDLSFQLSFFATLGLLIFLPSLEEHFQKWPTLLKGTMIVTLSAQVFTLPIILYHFERFSVIAPLANLLILPFLPLLMLLGFVALLLSYLFWPLALFIGGLSWFLVLIMTFLVKVMAHFPFASLKIQEFSVYIAMLYYFFFAMLIFFKLKQKTA